MMDQDGNILFHFIKHIVIEFHHFPENLHFHIEAVLHMHVVIMGGPLQFFEFKSDYEH
jgi:hypothetical protein